MKIKLYWIMVIIFWITTFAAWIATPESVVLNSVLLVLGLALVLGRLIYKQKSLMQLIGDLKLRKIIAISITLIFIGMIWAIVNYMGYKKQARWELLTDRDLDLSKQTKVLVNSLKTTKLKLLTKRERWSIFLPILKRVAEINEGVELEAHDLDLEPSLIEKYHLTGIDALILESDHKRVITYFSEKKRVEEVLVNALLKFSQEKSLHIVFSKGYGEYLISDEGNQGLSFLKRKLMEQNFIVTSVDLSKDPIPVDTSLLVLWGIRRTLDTEGVSKIQEYLSHGGQVLIAQGPLIGEDYFLKMRDLLKDWDIKISNNMIIDKIAVSEGMEPTIAHIASFNESHPVLSKFKEKVYLPLTSSVEATQNHNDKRAILMMSSNIYPAVWAEGNLQEVMSGSATCCDGKDQKGPVGVMVSSQMTYEPFGGVVVVGSSSFALNNYSAQTPHFQLLLNTISWQLGQSEMILEQREGLRRSPIILSQRHLYLIFYFSVLLLPLLALMGAFYFYLKKRHQ